MFAHLGEHFSRSMLSGQPHSGILHALLVWFVAQFAGEPVVNAEIAWETGEDEEPAS